MANSDETQILMKHKQWWNTNTNETQFGWKQDMKQNKKRNQHQNCMID